METAQRVHKKTRTGFTNPTEIAREALRQLAARRVAPTPENYRELYHEIAGAVRPGEPPPEAGGVPSKAWARLLKDVVAHIAPSRAEGVLQSKLRELDQMLAAPPPTSSEFHTHAMELVRSWPVAGLEPDARAAPGRPLSPFQETLARILESAVIVHVSETDDLVREARAFAQRLRTDTGEARLRKLGGELRQFVRRLELQADNSAEVKSGLLRLLRLLVDNAGDLVADDSWISGQLEVVRGIVERPDSLPMLQEAEQRLKQILLRQGTIKRGIQEAQSTLKTMVAEFIDHLGSVSEHTGDYGRKVETYSVRIRQAEGIAGLNKVLAELLDDTGAMREFAQRSREELLAARDRARCAEQRIRQLESELSSASEKVREDPLTGTLNRRGFNDAFARESARAQRRETPLCLALLDVDDFKQINDSHGHRVGDDALRHLASVVRDTVRPNDVVARFGGEEFLILFPDTELTEAVNVAVRLQRGLTKQFFLHNNDKLLITFSAGVTPWAPGESQESVIARADQALYCAKKAGKNRVLEANPAAPPTK